MYENDICKVKLYYLLQNSKHMTTLSNFMSIHMDFLELASKYNGTKLNESL